MRSSGEMAERLAEQYLGDAGLELVARNFRCRMGEIDLIMREGSALVFVEVRLRQRPDFGGAAASIQSRKQQRLIRAAHHYLATLPSTPACRFDVVLFDALESARIEWIRNAFEA
jgi:putative endonuclease